MEELNEGEDKPNRKRQSKKQREREDQLLGIRKMLSTRDGRAFMWRLLKESGWAGASFSTNALEMAFFEGRRSIGSWLIVELDEAESELYLKMRQEAIEDGRHNARK